MDKETVNLVIVGHIDHGKSTLIGRLMYDTGSLTDEKLEEIRQSSKDMGKQTEFAYIMDHLEEERQRGITIDTAQIFFETQKRKYVIIDTPGHREFLKNMITGSSYADIALLIIDAEEGVKDQTKRHCYILDLLGFRDVIVVVNKMDLVNNSVQRFEEVKNQINDYLANLNIKVSECIPVSAMKGDNIIKSSGSFSWFDGCSFLDTLDSSRIKRKKSGNLCLPVQDIYDFVSENKHVIGRVESGSIKKGQDVFILPGRTKTSVDRITTFDDGDKSSAGTGECIGIIFKNGIPVKRGDIITDKEFTSVSNIVKGNIFWMTDREYNSGEKLIFKCATQKTVCRIDKVHKKYDPATLALQETENNSIKHAEIADVNIITETEVVTTQFEKLPELGRFVLEQNGVVAAGGIVV